MKIYRVTKKKYTETAFTGSCGRGRWHEQGVPMVYAADAPSTALLETLVHVNRRDLLRIPFVVLTITLDINRHLLRLPTTLLPPDWQQWPWSPSTQELGSYWYREQLSIVLEVPSAVLPMQHNYLINAHHPQFDELEIEGPVDLPVDPRLLKK